MENEGVTFITKEQKEKAWEGKKEQINCNHCGEKGHIKSECPKYRAISNMTVEGVSSKVGGNQKAMHCVIHSYQCCGFELILGMAD